ncbi:hypothetical protein ACEQ8H_008972 [Pleosporales sp. CAS-2024a]
MQALRRTAGAAGRKGRTTLPRQQRRFAHDEHAHGHGHTVDEPLGKGFLFSVATIPAGWALYYASRNNSDNSAPLVTRLIDRYTETNETWTKRNDLHVRMMEQAGADRVLFQHSKAVDHVDMKFPEIMNVGSPYNVPAGSQVSMEKVIEKYKQLAYADNEAKLEALKHNAIKSEQPFEARMVGARGAL